MLRSVRSSAAIVRRIGGAGLAEGEAKQYG
jgi:hypothetical protein